MTAWRAACIECGASDAECDDADYLTGTGCCDQCHHTSFAQPRWTSSSSPEPTTVASAEFDDPDLIDTEAFL